MTTKEIITGKLFPSSISFKNYKTALNTAPLFQFFINSVIVSLTGMIFQLINCSAVAFVITFMRFKLKKIAIAFFFISMLIPWDAIVVPNYTNIIEWHLLNSRWALILPFISNGLGIFLMIQFFKTINKSLIEAAKVDGASYFTIYKDIVLPLSKPVLSTWAIYSFLSIWNMYLWPLMVTTKPNARTLQTGLTMLKVQESQNGWAMLMAAVTMVILPPLIVIFIGQKQLQEGLQSGGVKG
jgi:sn-glycerol 3-phosphate transport system permease protein